MTRAEKLLTEWSVSLKANRWRGLVWLSGESVTCRQRALALWRQNGWQAPCWVSAECPAGLVSSAGEWMPASKARTRLGGEHDLLVFDSGDDGRAFDPDAFGALTGTLRAGGLVLLLTPLAWGEAAASRYLARLERLLGASALVATWPGSTSAPRFPSLPASPPEAAPAEDPDCLTADQARAVARLVRLKRRRPLVLTADRGRGKTAALGIACARLLAAGEAEVRVTAPRPAAVAALFERLSALRPRGERQGNTFFDASGGRVDFLAPDALAELTERGAVGGAGSVLLVDEAAAIPAALLGQWLAAFPRIAFATTVHGYEGSGRGFALRFRERLDRQAPAWREEHLAAPVRWAAGDPLERLVSELLLLDAEPPVAASTDSPLTRRHWRRDALARDESRLRAIFGLLVQAHYRTTPTDLRRLLDDPVLRLTTLTAAEDTQAVVVCADEGGFCAELADQVARGKRRPPGHLLAQSLAAHAGSRDAVMSRVRRVQRIAVHPARRRQGVGRRLLEAELEEARATGVDLLGASFGAEPGLIAFWQALGFRPVRLGLSRETATGELALMVVAPTSEHGDTVTRVLVEHFQRLLPALLAFELCELAPEVALRLLAEAQVTAVSRLDRRECADVAYGFREPATARPALQALVRHHLAATDPPVDAELVGWAFQGRDTAWLADRLELAGRREVMAWLRQAVARLLAALPDAP